MFSKILFVHPCSYSIRNSVSHKVAFFGGITAFNGGTYTQNNEPAIQLQLNNADDSLKLYLIGTQYGLEFYRDINNTGQQRVWILSP